MGSRGLPLGLPPHWGRVGVTLAISSQAQQTRGDFYRAKIGVIHTKRISNHVTKFENWKQAYLPSLQDGIFVRQSGREVTKKDDASRNAAWYAAAGHAHDGDVGDPD